MLLDVTSSLKYNVIEANFKFSIWFEQSLSLSNIIRVEFENFGIWLNRFIYTFKFGMLCYQMLNL